MLLSIMICGKANIIAQVINLPRSMKRLILICIDAVMCSIATWISFYLRLGELPGLHQLLGPIILSICLAIPAFLLMGLYREIVRYSGWLVFRRLVMWMTVYGMTYANLLLLLDFEHTPRTIGIIQPLVLVGLLIGIRLIATKILSRATKSGVRSASLKHVVIYGAGSAGRQMALVINQSHTMRVVRFVDDDRTLQGQYIDRIEIGCPASLPNIIRELDVAIVLLAMPSVSSKLRRDALEKLVGHRVDIRTLPPMTELVAEALTLESVKPLDIDDLLGREVVEPDNDLLVSRVTDKGVLVTGAGGSIGSELCKLLVDLKPRCLILVEMNEYALYSIHDVLASKSNADDGLTLIPYLCSAADVVKMRDIIESWSINTIYHAAAYKHVSIVESNPTEGIRNNVFGSLSLAQIALNAGVDDCVLVSTDKAVRPTNVMGASKRLAELVFQGLQGKNNAKTRFSIVRFGNVLASSGSVIPRFRAQIASGGPVTVTDMEVTRFFMTVREAAQLVLQAGALAKGGDVFVLDMGEPVKILDLAKRMIRLSGLTQKTSSNPEGDIEIIITGLRPGEKLYEELLIGGDAKKTQHPKIMTADEAYIPWTELSSELSELKLALDGNDVATSLEILARLVKEYAFNNKAWPRGYKNMIVCDLDS